jgi:transposase InsO family protein
MSERGAPAVIRSDNGPEFLSTAVLKWLTENKIKTVHVDPGKPWQINAQIARTFIAVQEVPIQNLPYA